MKLEITVLRNGLLLNVAVGPSSSDPLAQRAVSGTWFARDTTDLIGRLAALVKGEFDPIVDQFDRD